jgi:pimeloyl-ACP methyl ester carboxylesterase
MRDREAKRKMTDTELEKHGPNNEEDLPVVLLHGTSGQSEDWSQVVEQLTSHCPVIRLNYAEPVIGVDSADAPAIPDFADRVVAAARAGGIRSLVLVSGFGYGGDPRMRLQFDLWLHLARTEQGSTLFASRRTPVRI